VLVAESSSYALDDRLIEQNRLVYRGDRYRFRATLIAQPSALDPLPVRSRRSPRVSSPRAARARA
jgi:hypothetical protein